MQTLPLLTDADRARITQSILAKYEAVARTPLGNFRYPTGLEGLAGQGYDPALTGRLPLSVRQSFCGVGNPWSLGLPAPGETVLDVGCGAGVDTLLAALLTGPQGEATGLEFSPAMLARARANQAESGVANARFVPGNAEALPFADRSFDLVVSSGVFNLVVDKEKALAEAFRVLKSGGRLQVADQMLTAPPARDSREVVDSWFR